MRKKVVEPVVIATILITFVLALAGIWGIYKAPEPLMSTLMTIIVLGSVYSLIARCTS